MKKALLIAAAAAMAVPAFAAQKDGCTYAAIDGYTFENLWINSVGTGQWHQYVTDGVFPTVEKITSGAALGDKIYIGSSADWGVDEAGSPMMVDGNGLLLVFDYNTGEYIKSLDLTIDGAPYAGTLCANNIGTDDFGHLYVAGTVFTPMSDDGTATPFKIYIINPETGAMTLAVAPEIDEIKSGRTDFVSVSGDLTREQAPLVVMAAPDQVSQSLVVYNWYYEKGSDEAVGNFSDGSIVAELEESYPEQSNWGQCCKIFIVPDEDYSGALFYVDGNSTYPAIYDLEGGMTTSFADVVEPGEKGSYTFYPVAAPCGAVEFTLGDDAFLVYGFEEHTNGEAYSERNRANLCRYGEIGDMSTLELVARFPENGLMNDGIGNAYGGRRLHTFCPVTKTDANGKEAVEILNIKPGNGMSLYRLAQEGYTAGIESATVVPDNNAPVEFFNLQGMRVENPENGLFIRRQGSNVTKVIL